MPNNLPLNIPALLLFSAVVFWPVVLFLGFLGFGIVVALFMAPLPISDFIQVFLMFVPPIILIIFCYRACLSANWKKRGWIIYGAWILLSLEMCFLLMAGLGGASMAVVEGVASNYRFLQYLFYAFMGTIIAHVVLVPWVFVSIFLLKKIGEKRVFPNNNLVSA